MRTRKCISNLKKYIFFLSSKQLLRMTFYKDDTAFYRHTAVIKNAYYFSKKNIIDTILYRFLIFIYVIVHLGVCNKYNVINNMSNINQLF